MPICGSGGKTSSVGDRVATTTAQCTLGRERGRINCSFVCVSQRNDQRMAQLVGITLKKTCIKLILICQWRTNFSLPMFLAYGNDTAPETMVTVKF